MAGNLILKHEVVNHDASVHAVAFDPRGDLIATGCWDNKLRIIRASTARVEAIVEHGGAVYAVAFRGDGSWIATGSLDEKLRVIRSSDAQVFFEHKHDGPIYSVAFSQSKRTNLSYLATGCHDNNLRILLCGEYSIDANFEIIRQTIKHDDVVNAIAFNQKGDLMASGSDDMLGIFCDKTMPSYSRRGFYGKLNWEVTFEAHVSDGVYAVAFNPEGDLLAAGCNDKIFRVIHAKTGEVKFALRLGSLAHAIAFHPNGKLIATGCFSGELHFICAATGAVECTVSGEHGGEVFALAFHPVGGIVVTGCRDGTLRFFSWRPSPPERKAFRAPANVEQDATPAPSVIRAPANFEQDATPAYHRHIYDYMGLLTNEKQNVTEIDATLTDSTCWVHRHQSATTPDLGSPFWNQDGVSRRLLFDYALSGV